MRSVSLLPKLVHNRGCTLFCRRPCSLPFFTHDGNALIFTTTSTFISRAQASLTTSPLAKTLEIESTFGLPFCPFTGNIDRDGAVPCGPGIAHESVNACRIGLPPCKHSFQPQREIHLFHRLMPCFGFAKAKCPRTFRVGASLTTNDSEWKGLIGRCVAQVVASAADLFLVACDVPRCMPREKPPVEHHFLNEYHDKCSNEDTS